MGWCMGKQHPFFPMAYNRISLDFFFFFFGFRWFLKTKHHIHTQRSDCVWDCFPFILIFCFSDWSQPTSYKGYPTHIIAPLRKCGLYNPISNILKMVCVTKAPPPPDPTLIPIAKIQKINIECHRLCLYDDLSGNPFTTWTVYLVLSTKNVSIQTSRCWEAEMFDPKPRIQLEGKTTITNRKPPAPNTIHVAHYDFAL